jgi:hypothetical protein
MSLVAASRAVSDWLILFGLVKAGISSFNGVPTKIVPRGQFVHPKVA